jgi:hypothetical protein
MMTPETAVKALRIMDEERREEDGVVAEQPTPSERAFAIAFFRGETAGNATRSYLATYPGSSYDAASVEASGLLKTPRVRAFLDQLYNGVIADTVSEMRPWAELRPLAQRVIVATAQSQLRNRLAYEAAVYLINRAEGTPTANIDIAILTREQVIVATKSFLTRAADEQRLRRIPTRTFAAGAGVSRGSEADRDDAPLLAESCPSGLMASCPGRPFAGCAEPLPVRDISEVSTNA